MHPRTKLRRTRKRRSPCNKPKFRPHTNRLRLHRQTSHFSGHSRRQEICNQWRRPTWLLTWRCNSVPLRAKTSTFWTSEKIPSSEPQLTLPTDTTITLLQQTLSLLDKDPLVLEVDLPNPSTYSLGYLYFIGGRLWFLLVTSNGKNLLIGKIAMGFSNQW